MTIRRRRLLTAAGIVAAGLIATACGSEEVDLRANEQPSVTRGANLFAERCGGCHTMDVAGAQGGATEIKDRERVDGPNFNVRRESRDSVLYAIRNGGFSGAIMPENIVVGQDADDVAAFLAKYAGADAKRDVTPAPPATTTQTQTTPPVEAAADGKKVFTDNCAACHTLKAAAATGQVGPDLDQVKPDEATTQKQVENGGGAMPAFKGVITDPEIQAVSKYVADNAGG